MGVTNLYPNLPGHLVEFKDGGLQLTSDNNAEATGKSRLRCYFFRSRHGQIRLQRNPPRQ